MTTLRNNYGWKFLLIVALPLLLAFVGVVLLSADLVSRVSTGANREDHTRTQQTVHSSLVAAQQQLEFLVSDNAYWNDAVRNSYGAVSDDWFLETWGSLTEEAINYDAVMLVDRDLPEAVSGYFRGKKFTPAVNWFLSERFAALLDSLPQDTKTFASKSSILDTQEGLAILAIAPILPTSDDLIVPSSHPRHLLFLKFITPEYLAKIGKQYVIQDFNIAAIDIGNAGGEIINDFAGKPVAVAQWTDRRPGDIAMVTVRRETVFALSSLALVLLGITFLYWKSATGFIRAVEAEAKANENTEMFKDLNHQVTLLNLKLASNVKQLSEAKEESLRKAKMAQLGNLVATVAHELRNPLAIVRTASFILKRKLADVGADVGPQITRIESGISRCDNIISQLLDFSRTQKLNTVETDIDTWLEAILIEETGKMHEALNVTGNLQLRGCMAHVDPDRMQRAVINLITNCAEAMVDRHGPLPLMQSRTPGIAVATKLTGRGIEISVEDNGPGILPEIMEKIREPLFTTKGFGTGLGIPAVEKIMELHGGGLDIDSIVGRGTRLTIWFPATPSIQSDQQAA
jgi:signal transduction histidine kinase